jgi:hypothetical protein
MSLQAGFGRGRRRRGCVVAATVFASLLAAPPCPGQETDRAEIVESWLGRADFERAEIAARDALASGSLSPPSAARVHLSLGIVAAARRDPEGAEACFRKALVLDSKIELPQSAGPHVIESFEHAKETLTAKLALTISAVFERDSDPSHVLVNVELSGNSEGLIQRLVVRGDGVYDVRSLQRPGIRFVEALPASPLCISLVASAADEWGNELWPTLAKNTVCRPGPPAVRDASAASANTPSLASQPPASDKSVSVRSRPVPACVWIALAFTGGFAATTTVLGLVALDRRDAFNRANADAQQPVESRSHLRSDALTAEHVATVAGIATGAAAGVAAGLYLFPGRRGEATSIAVEAGPSGQRLVVSGSF